MKRESKCTAHMQWSLRRSETDHYGLTIEEIHIIPMHYLCTLLFYKPLSAAVSCKSMQISPLIACFHINGSLWSMSLCTCRWRDGNLKVVQNSQEQKHMPRIKKRSQLDSVAIKTPTQSTLDTLYLHMLSHDAFTWFNLSLIEFTRSQVYWFMCCEYLLKAGMC